MYKCTARKLAFLVLLVLLAGPVDRALAADTGQATTPAASSSTSTSDGITGTDPEPIDPSIVYVVLALLGLA